MQHVKFVGDSENINPRDVYKHYLIVDRDKIAAWDQAMLRKQLSYFKDCVIRQHSWTKGQITVGDLMRVYMNPGSKWLKRFSCTCGNVQYPCHECASQNHTFADFIQNYKKVWDFMHTHQLDLWEEPKSDTQHKREMEEMCQKLRYGMLTPPVIMVHELNAAEAAETDLPLGSPIVSDGNHRLAATLMAKSANDTITVFYGELNI